MTRTVDVRLKCLQLVQNYAARLVSGSVPYSQRTQVWTLSGRFPDRSFPLGQCSVQSRFISLNVPYTRLRHLS